MIDTLMDLYEEDFVGGRIGAGIGVVAGTCVGVVASIETTQYFKHDFPNCDLVPYAAGGCCGLIWAVAGAFTLGVVGKWVGNVTEILGVRLPIYLYSTLGSKISKKLDQRR